MRPAWTLLALLGCGGTTTDTEHTGVPSPPSLEDVQAALDAANHCADASDCVDLGAQCPFGCWILVNADEAAAVQAEIDAFFAGGGSECTYSCASRGEIRCDAGKCAADSTTY